MEAGGGWKVGGSGRRREAAALIAREGGRGEAGEWWTYWAGEKRNVML